MASPISAGQSALQGSAAKESRVEFDRRMSNTVSRLDMTDTIFFWKNISRSMATEAVTGSLAYSLEFPQPFMTKYAEKLGKKVKFVTTSSHQIWPIKLSLRIIGARLRVFARGHDGWKAFVMDNHIKVGDTLIFKLISWSRFEVVIGRSPAEVHSNDNNIVNQENTDQDNADEASPQIVSSNNLPLWPKFMVTICCPIEPKHQENHFYLENDLSLLVPSHFWELYSHMLEADELRLEGPFKTITKVKVERTYNRELQKVCLKHSGWKAFLLANNLAIADVLEFSLIANSCFKFKVVEQIENH